MNPTEKEIKRIATTQPITDRVTAIIPETEEYIEHTIIIAKMNEGITISQAGQSIWIAPYALEAVIKTARKLNK